MKKKPKRRNPVAKYLRKFNKATTQRDRKKAVKRGYIKHKLVEVMADDTTY